MFYDTRDNSRPLPHDPFKAIVAPRPIGWITTISAAGQVNLAPYSYFNGVLSRPNLVMFSSEGFKDSVRNIEETGEFVCSLATWDLREAMNATSAPVPHGINEMDKAGLAPAPSKLVKPPRVAESPINIECTYYTTIVLPGHTMKTNHAMVIGRVVGVHIHDDYLTADGRIDVLKIRPLARLGYADYTSVQEIFPIVLADDERGFRMRNLSGG